SAASRSIISASVAIPAVRQKRSKLAPTSRQASSTPDATAAVGVISFFMALLSFADSTPRAYTGSRRATPPPYFNNGRDIPQPRRFAYCYLTLFYGYHYNGRRPWAAAQSLGQSAMVLELFKLPA